MKRIIIMCLALSACTSAGIKVDQSKMAQFHKGSTTESQVIAALGPPTNFQQNDDGTHAISYVYTSTQARPESFIPYVGVFVGGADTEQTAALFTFDRHDILTHISHSQGGMGVGMGFEGMSQDRKSVREAD